MKRPNNPCKGCKDRWVDETTTCHAKCLAYAEFNRLNQEYNDEVRKNAVGYHAPNWYQTPTGWWRRK